MGENYIITGAAMGFGKEFSRRVLESGGKVVLADKNVTAGEETTRELKERFGEKKCIFCELDVTDRGSWRQMWDKAAEFFDDKIDVLVNNAGVSPKLGYDICMKINLDGVMNGVQLFEEKLSKTNGGPGGLIINTASCAGLTHTEYHDSLAYWISKHAVVTITRNLGGQKIVRKTGIKHVALCPWFAETAIVDQTTKEMVMKKSPIKFVSVERVGEAFVLATKEQRSGGLIAVLPNTPLVYYPDTLMETGVIVYLLSKNCFDVKRNCMNSSLEVEVSTAALWPWHWVGPIVVTTAYLGCLVGMGFRHRHNIEAVHIIELNALLDFIIATVCVTLQNLVYYLQDDLYCIIIHSIQRWAKFSFDVDCSIGEIDKFLSLYWSIGYNVRVTNTRALVLVITVKILLIPVTVTAALLDTESLRCSRESLNICGLFKSTDFFWTTIPRIISFTVTIAVSIYTIKVARRLANTVTPVVNLQPVISTISRSSPSHSHEVACRIVPPLNNIISNAWTLELLQTAKRAVKFNTISLCTLGLSIPENIIITLVFFLGINCKNDPDFPSIVKCVMYFHVIFLFIYPYFIWRKLKFFI